MTRKKRTHRRGNVKVEIRELYNNWIHEVSENEESEMPLKLQVWVIGKMVVPSGIIGKMGIERKVGQRDNEFTFRHVEFMMSGISSLRCSIAVRD